MEVLKQKITELLENKSFDRANFPLMDEMICHIENEIAKGSITKEDIAVFNRSFGDDFLNNTMHGHALMKPFGYAGDFLIIDKIYTSHTSAIPEYVIWDEYFHNHSAPKAVRNRKEYFKKILQSKLNGSELKLLNIASGPARDIYEIYSSLENKETLITTCIEMDAKAIDYAKELNKEFIPYINFINKNIFKYDTEEKYDLVWSAGLFDYFDDKAFLMILNRMKKWILPGGEIIIGNFNEANNPSRGYMEIFGEWYLHHRTEEDLIKLAEQAGFKQSQIQIGKEDEDVNLFLHLRNE
jgi:SAM-dependent methyltransferase